LFVPHFSGSACVVQVDSNDNTIELGANRPGEIVYAAGTSRNVLSGNVGATTVTDNGNNLIFDRTISGLSMTGPVGFHGAAAVAQQSVTGSTDTQKIDSVIAA